VKVEDAVAAVVDELKRARSKFPAFHSQHEGYAVLLEEVVELQEAVFRNRRDQTAVYEEAVQVAAMALRFLVDTVLVDAVDEVPVDAR
jgi:hypothetical protein